MNGESARAQSSPRSPSPTAHGRKARAEVAPGSTPTAAVCTVHSFASGGCPSEPKASVAPFTGGPWSVAHSQAGRVPGQASQRDPTTPAEVEMVGRGGRKESLCFTICLQSTWLSCVCVSMSVFVYLHTYVSVSTCVYACMYVSACASVCLHVHECMHGCLRVHMCVRVHA